MTLTPHHGPDEVTVVVTSCGRQDLLARTLESFWRYNTFPISQFLVVEDGDATNNVALSGRHRERGVTWLATGSRQGQVAAIDFAYGVVQTEFIFHCEDDWEFLAPGFVEKSLTILRSNPRVLQVWLRALKDTNNHPVLEDTLLAENVPYRFLQPEFRSEEWGVWHGFTWNPGLRRRRDYERIGSFAKLDPLRTKPSYEVERDASAFYFELGFVAAILADNDGLGYVRHLGWGRRVGD
jgi:hypothetical protein